MREKARNISDADFETMVKSVLVNIEAKDKNVAEEHTRLFNTEVSLHRY
jgi:secreted Zn-dependent insulinase-like peptidase